VSDELLKPSPGLFLCKRTSDVGLRPCPDAFAAQIKLVDRRDTDDPRKIWPHYGQDAWWYEKGDKHRVEGGKIVRELGTKVVWVVRLQGDSAIMSFIRQHGRCVLSVNDDGFNEIEIYDTYRE
jgi:hypothetical protein